MIRYLCLMTFVWSCSTLAAQELDCLSAAERESLNLYTQLQQRAYGALDGRLQTYDQLKTPEEIAAYQQRMRKFLTGQLGGFPERTALNARTVRTIEMDGYRIENVIFESQPGHHITANLYLPDVDGKVPGIVVSSGHSRTAKTADYNQRFGIAMAKHGMAALCFDPIGQGERSQSLTPDGQPTNSGTTTEHFLMGVGSTLVGRNTARYRVWDAMRSIDYISSRPEVDAGRIGFTGCSGGGTLTSYVMALDDRVACAAPACYLTTFQRLIETIGPQDAEQNIYGQIAFGMDQPDYVLMRAPRPTLISSTTEDFFAIDGSWENFRQAKRIYGKLGFPERVDLVEVEGKHGVQPQNLATITQWMRRWLLRDDSPVAATVYTTLAPEVLLCTESGQVLTLPGEKSVYDLNSEHASQLAEQRRASWERSSVQERVAQVADVLHVRLPADRGATAFEDKGRVKRDGYHIDKLTMTSDQGVVLPALTFHPPSPLDEAYLFLHEDGKLGESGTGQAIEKLIEQGFAVVSVDLRGQGETGSGKRDPVLTDWKTYSLAYLLGEPMLGLRTEDALTAADFVAFYQKDRSSPRKVHLVGTGSAGIVALHAAAIHPDRFASVTVRDTPTDWASVVKDRQPTGQLDSAVHGVLGVYDLPDLVEIIGKDKVHDSAGSRDSEK
ncbi:MAG: alpha/beta fold hydrolase [Planctomycetaceae bacterium]|nr:alpha/beta fold hydrolase [Planctomycetaceae bacterium]